MDSGLKVMRRLWAVLEAPQKRSLRLLVALSLATALAELFLLAAVIPFAYALSTPQATGATAATAGFERWPSMFGSALDSSVAQTGLLFLAAILLASAMRMLTLRSQARVAKDVAEYLALRGYWNTLNRPYIEHVRSNTSQTMLTLTGPIDRVTGSAILLWVSVLSQSFIAVSIVAAMMLVNAWATLVLVATVVGTYTIFLWRARELVARESERHNQALSAVTRVLAESLFGIRDVLLTGSQEKWREYYRQAQHALRSANERIFVTTATPRIVVEFAGFAILIGIACLLVGADASVQALPVLATIILGSQRLLPVVQSLYGSWSNFQSALPYLKQVVPLLESDVAPHASAETPYQLRDRLELRHLRFTYPGADRPVIGGANLIIGAGETVGIIGRTGCGKSTLLDLITGLLRPDRGEVAIDGVPLASIDLLKWQAAVAHVPQSIYLADTTIGENIVLGSGDAIDVERVRDALALAELDTFVDALPLGLDTEVGERGILLSGGQRQRIGIARALYRGSDILILDEATSSLDQETEAEVLANIRSLRPRKTIIIVTHRLSSLEHCGHIHRLKDGALEGPLSFAGLTARSRGTAAKTPA